MMRRGFKEPRIQYVIYFFDRPLRELGTHVPDTHIGGGDTVARLSEMGDKTIPNFRSTYIPLRVPQIYVRC